MSRLKVAAAQIECRPGEIAANLATHLAVAAQARELGIDLLVFPELSLTDYLSEPDNASLALDPADATLTLLAEAAFPTCVSAGFIERDAAGRHFNAQVLLADRKVAGIHRKLNLPGYGRLREDRAYTPGESLALTPLAGGWQLATLICADSWNPALPWLAALAGANLLIMPAASSLDAVGDDFDNARGWDINLTHTALTYGLPTIFANHCGRRGGFDFWGGSRILDAAGRELARAGSGPELIVAELALADGQAARQALPTIRDSDPALVQRLLAKFLSQRPEP
jgi:predicted amidohydrolase